MAAPVTLAAFVLLAATYVPRNQIQAALHTPWCSECKSGRSLICSPTERSFDALLFGAFRS